jgi:hypothetical protein
LVYDQRWDTTDVKYINNLSIIPVHCPVLDRLAEVGQADVLIPRQVGDRPRHLERAVVGPCAESQLGHGRLEELLAFMVDATEGLDVLRPHPGIAEDPPVSEPGQLDLPRPDDALPDGHRALPLGPAHDVLELHAGHLDLDVDPVEQRPGDLAVVFAPLDIRALLVPAGQPAQHVLAGLRCPFAIWFFRLKSLFPLTIQKYWRP